METIVLTRADFKKLLTCLDIVNNSNCTDCDISKGLVRQKTNDRQCIIEMDLTSLLYQNDISLSMVKTKAGLLSSFQLDNNVKVDDENVTIEIDDKVYHFLDCFSKLNFTKPMSKFMDNKYIGDEEFASMLSINDDKLLFSGVVSSYVKKRIKTVCMGLAVDTIICTMNETTAKLSLTTVNNESSTNLNQQFDLNSHMDLCTARITTMPFSLDVESDLNLSVYKVTAERFLCKFSMVYAGIPINIYTQTQIDKKD